MGSDSKNPNANAGLAKSVGRNTIFGIFSNVTQVATRLVTVPIVISHLGLDGYGIWSIIMTTATYMRFGSVGLKTAFQKYVAEATGDNNFERANKLLSTGFTIMLVLSLAGLVPLVFYSHKIAATAGVPERFLGSAAGAISLLGGIFVLANAGATYEAIVMGANRIDLVRKFATVLTILEACGIVAVLHFGHGLFAMAAVMGASEIGYISACYIASKRVLSQVHLDRKHFDRGVIPELVRFAGSYQLLNILEVLYASILPFTILRAFGATGSGVYAVINRVVASAVMIQDSFLPSVLSGGAMVFASGSKERLKNLFVKSFKATEALSLLPLGFIGLFGGIMAYAWTGQSDSRFALAFCLVCLTGLFRSFSLLAVVLYRTSGKASLDNLRQVIRILIILAVVWVSPELGFYGVLAGLALAELVGLIFMLFALTRTFEVFQAGMLVPDLVRWTLSTAVILAAGWLAGHLSLPMDVGIRFKAAIQLSAIALGCLLVSWPVLVLSGAITKAESHALLGSVWPRRSPKPSVVI